MLHEIHLHCSSTRPLSHHPTFVFHFSSFLIYPLRLLIGPRLAVDAGSNSVYDDYLRSYVR
jgi:hypothetical protein